MNDEDEFVYTVITTETEQGAIWLNIEANELDYGEYEVTVKKVEK